jgi:hypothetical protein
MPAVRVTIGGGIGVRRVRVRDAHADACRGHLRCLVLAAGFHRAGFPRLGFRRVAFRRIGFRGIRFRRTGFRRVVFRRVGL